MRTATAAVHRKNTRSRQYAQKYDGKFSTIEVFTIVQTFLTMALKCENTVKSIPPAAAQHRTAAGRTAGPMTVCSHKSEVFGQTPEMRYASRTMKLRSVSRRGVRDRAVFLRGDRLRSSAERERLPHDRGGPAMCGKQHRRGLWLWIITSVRRRSLTT